LGAALNDQFKTLLHDFSFGCQAACLEGFGHEFIVDYYIGSHGIAMRVKTDNLHIYKLD